MKRLRLFLLGLSILQISACAKQEGRKTEARVPTYGYVGENCVDLSSQSVVDPSKCPHQAIPPNDKFSWVGADCLNKVTRKLVNGAYCEKDQFKVRNGRCFDDFEKKFVVSQYCPEVQTRPREEYYFEGGICYSSLSGRKVSSSFCGVVEPGEPCLGLFVHFYSGLPQVIFCAGRGCTGMTLYTLPGFEVKQCH